MVIFFTLVVLLLIALVFYIRKRNVQKIGNGNVIRGGVVQTINTKDAKRSEQTSEYSDIHQFGIGAYQRIGDNDRVPDAADNSSHSHSHSSDSYSGGSGDFGGGGSSSDW